VAAKSIAVRAAGSRPFFLTLQESPFAEFEAMPKSNYVEKAVVVFSVIGIFVGEL
jgi:hypothetical protein